MPESSATTTPTRDGNRASESVRHVRLSVLESTRAERGMSGYAAIEQTVAVAAAADECGYHRLWVTEHHGQAEIASCAPAVLVAHLAARTRTLRVGAGGVQLVNHSPLVVAEQFRTLEALHPGRIDLGIGGGPGSPTDLAVYGQALGRSPDFQRDYPRRVDDLIAFVSGEFPGGHRYREIPISPRVRPVPVFLLGQSVRGAGLAAERGLPFAFAHHLGVEPPATVLTHYRASFRPSRALSEPYVIVSVGVSCTPVDAADSSTAASLPHSWVVGDGSTVTTALAELASATAANELMVMPIEPDGPGRIRTLRMIADGLGAQHMRPATGSGHAVRLGAGRETSRGADHVW